eukprot:Hpha_TRINITY_DN15487_c1_g2::TRINITY_DN15487_c1_g2_i1::g.177339::m.177339/K00130/betB, gbsA; betaine-aldehyde dehydrogenase
MKQGAVATVLKTQRRSMSRVSEAAKSTIERVSQGIFIDNKLVKGEGKEIEVWAPMTGAKLCNLQNATAAQVHAAIASSRTAFTRGTWSEDVVQRQKVLKEAATELRQRIDEFSEIETLDNGKTLGESKGDIGYCIDVLDYYADLAVQRFKDQHISVPDVEGGFKALTVAEPVGVVGAVSPWNFPLMQAVLKIAPAVAAGCTVIAKPAAQASLTTLAFGELLAKSGAPPGVLNVLTGGPPAECEGKSTGQFLTEADGIDKISFTGSSLAGGRILASSAPHLRPCSLELGGKSSAIVFENANLDTALDWVLVGNYQATGQVCSATTRVLVQETIADEFIKRLKEKALSIRTGDPLSPDTQMGALISKEQKDKVLEAIEKARAEGCQVDAPELNLPGELAGGYYVAPHVITNLPPKASAWYDEIFGPVMSIRTFKSEEEVIDIANDTVYGLANAVFSKDTARCRRVSTKIRSGIVWENCSQALYPSTPFGGRVGTQSGFGHEGGVVGLEEYISRKCIVSAHSSYSWGVYGA